MYISDRMKRLAKAALKRARQRRAQKLDRKYPPKQPGR